MSSAAFYPTSPKDALAALYVGKSTRDVPTPAAVINVAAARRNCARMLQACEKLNLGWRAHVKTHKTVELTRLQVGADASRPVSLIVSTLAEAEFLLPMLTEYRSQGRGVNVLYGLPIAQNAVSRLAAVAKALGEGSVSVLLDDPAQLAVASELQGLSGVVPHAHIKIDMGGRRAGVAEDSARFMELADAALDAHRQGTIRLSGLYSHAGHSYGGDSRVAAIKMMQEEVGAMLRGADRLRARATDRALPALPSLVVSAGASPTALSVQNLLAGEDGADSVAPELQAETTSLSALFGLVKERGHAVEIHAGVYPTLDLQQLAAHSLSSSRLSWGDMALTVLADVHSVYPGRGADGTAEALIGSGGLALGREFCKAYDGMAMLTPWGRAGVEMPRCDVEDFQGWVVGRFSQEHGILTWRPSKATAGPPPEQGMVEVGQKVRLWPNHACITSSHFGWYFVVDEDRTGKEDEIVDIWTKARGW
ncbi:D-serine dehydratase [Tolypocladium ophioglossoides CBS 100239]|uniref:D-serine dehydratase n=1 Tax=Tolypocladium ophioglossoides (strain CBS 100239) TaxID=1163406 RepID=A0A0L0NAB3_TOLOC|nr:D-serine dehydratase [Tolypocladium ophioglossoides CBS 100239]